MYIHCTRSKRRTLYIRDIDSSGAWYILSDTSNVNLRLSHVQFHTTLLLTIHKLFATPADTYI